MTLESFLSIFRGSYLSWYVLFAIENYGRATLLVVDEVFTGHFYWLLKSHDVEDRRGYIGEDAVDNCCVLVFCNVNERYWVEGVCCI